LAAKAIALGRGLLQQHPP